ncbi:hypothetical protein [Paenibacillus sanguinis]|uniref:hypothetical protein n=1 Tax=Paenibacillus sanguinis TaxID=225906 RepID=UPI000361AC47|nr:hypothetical protein [Paenibacillus sanguinis]
MKNADDIKDAEVFTGLFLQFSNGIERWLRRLLLVLLMGLCLFQGLLQIPALRYYLSSADRYEGVPILRDVGQDSN